jgi:hypothetical protein
MCPTKKGVDECKSDENCSWNRIKSRCYKKSKKQNENKLTGFYARSICPTKKTSMACNFDDSCRWNGTKEKCYKKWVPADKLSYQINGFKRSFANRADFEQFIDFLEYYNFIFFISDEENYQISVDDQIFNIINVFILPEKYRIEKLRKMPTIFQQWGIPFDRLSFGLMQPNTPRRKYYKTNFYNNTPVILPNNRLFQISFGNPRQFTNYTQITSNILSECFIQTLFSLGLRNEKEGKKDVAKMKKKKSTGVAFVEAAKYFETIFGLMDGQIQYQEDTFNFSEYLPDMDDFFGEWLENNYATIISLLFFNPQEKKNFGHFMILYKFNDTLFYFDPQMNVHFQDLSHLVYYYEEILNMEMIYYGYYTTKNIKQPIELKTNACPIRFNDGG